MEVCRNRNRSSLLCVFFLSVFLLCIHKTQQSTGYFDPHNHYDGILPWSAYPNLTSYIEGKRVTPSEALSLWYFLNDTFYPQVFEEEIPVYNTDSRLGAGFISTLLLFQDVQQFTEDPEVLYGTLERLLSTTPFTEFDSAYAARSAITDCDNSSAYWMKNIFNNDSDALTDGVCTATLSELSSEGITHSELSIPFVTYSWDHPSQCFLDCLVDNPKKPHKLLLMALANRMAYYDEGHYLAWDETGECIPTPWSFLENITVDLEAEAALLIEGMKNYADIPLTGPNSCQDALSSTSQVNVWDILVGVDHAGPELSCVTEKGMSYFENVTTNMVNEVKRRNSKGLGWDGRPLVHHVHIGEGFTIYYGKEPIQTDNMTFSSVFGQLPGYLEPTPNIITNPEAASENVAAVVSTIADMMERNPEIAKFVIFRLGHVTHITQKTAEALSGLAALYPNLVEVDINLDSNLITHAYTIPSDYNINAELATLLSDESSNFRANDLSSLLIPDPTDVAQVGLVYGNFTALKYLLEAGVPVSLPIMLGTDASGTEHSPMIRQHQLATSLIEYWDGVDPEFEAMDIQLSYFNTSSNTHLRIMQRQGKISNWGVDLAIAVGACAAFLIVVLFIIWFVRRGKRGGDDYEPINNP